MTEIKNHIIDTFGNRLRTRVSGICIQNDEILLVKHLSIGQVNILWAPPGGGMQFGETAQECLKREMFEECGLDVEIGKLLFVNEYLDSPLHAIELFFEITHFEGILKKGYDPELSERHQIIQKVAWVPFEVINLGPKEEFHGILRKVNKAQDLLLLSGYYFDNKIDRN
jgi:8-oxo-dGTP diphosphatase